MRTKNNLLSKLSLIMATLFCLLIFVPSAKASSFNLTVGNTEPVSIPNSSGNGHATITSVLSSNTSIATIATSTLRPTEAIVTGVSTGSATLTIETRDTDSTKTKTTSLTVDVVSSSSSSTTGNTINLVAGNSSIVGSYSGVTNYTSSNPAVATLALSGGILTVTGVSAGNATLTYTALETGGTLRNYSTPVVVTASSNSTTTTTPTTGQSLTIEAGKNAKTAAFSSISTYQSADTNIATVKAESNSLIITGVSAGSTTVSYTGVLPGTTNSTSGTFNVTVTGSSVSITETTNENSDATVDDIEEGIKFLDKQKKLTFKLADKKRYRLSGVTLEGEAINVNKLLWVSTNDSIVTVGKTTGIMKPIKKGKAIVIAFDKNGKYMETTEITVK